MSEQDTAKARHDREQLRQALQGPAAWLLRLISTYNQQKSHPVQWFINPQAPSVLENVKSNYFSFTSTGSPVALLPLSNEGIRVQQEASEYFVVVGQGPKTPAMMAADALTALQSLICLNLNQPDQLWLALSVHYPPSLWIPIGNTSQAVQSAFDFYFPGPQSSVPETLLTGNVRFIIDDMSESEHPLTLQLFEAYSSRIPLINAAHFWGNKYLKDPYTQLLIQDKAFIENGPAEGAAILNKTLTEQSGVDLPTISFRSSHTQAIITLQQHYDFYVLQIRYRPMPEWLQHPLKAGQRLFDWPFPNDMSVDVIPACWYLHPRDSAQFGPSTQEGMQKASLPSRIVILYVMGVLGGPAIQEKLSFVLNDPNASVRWMALLVARWRGMTDYLRQMYAIERDPALRQALSTALAAPTPSAARPTGSSEVMRISMTLKKAYRFHMMAVALMENWVWMSPEGVQEEEGAQAIVWGLLEPATKITYIIYPPAAEGEEETHVLLLVGEQAGRLAVQLRELLPIYTFDEVANLIKHAANLDELDEGIRLFQREIPLHMSKPHFDLLALLLTHPEASIRQYAVRIMSPAWWPEFLLLLRPLITNDPNPDVRAEAQQMYQKIQQVMTER